MDRLNSAGELTKQFPQEKYFKNWEKIYHICHQIITLKAPVLTSYRKILFFTQ